MRLEKGLGVLHPRFGVPPVRAVLSRLRDLERLLRLAAVHRIVQREPLIRAHPDVDVDAERRARDADRIGPILEDVMHLTGRPVGHPLLDRRPVGQVEDGVDLVWIVDVIRRKTRRVRRARWLTVADVPPEIGRRHPEVEQPPFFPILVADGASEVRPFRRFGILRRVERIEANVTEPAGHADEVRRLGFARVLEVLLGIPVRLVEVWIGESAQADNAGRIPGYARHRRLFAFVHPQPVLIWACRGLAARLSDRAERGEPPAVQPRIDIREQVDVTLGQLGHLDPELLVAPGPEVPGIASCALRVVQIARTVPIVRFLIGCRRLCSPAVVNAAIEDDDRENGHQPDRATCRDGRHAWHAPVPRRLRWPSETYCATCKVRSRVAANGAPASRRRASL